MNRKELFAIIAGEISVWYDFIIFYTLAPLIFKNIGTNNKYLEYFPVILTSILVPFGAVLWGKISDKKGAYTTLFYTPIFMILSSVIVLFTSSSNNFQIFLLFISRIIQGLCIGGDSAANSVIIYNNAKNQNKFRHSFLCGSTSIIGFFLALSISYLIVNYFGEENWKISFIISIFITTITLLLRLKFLKKSIANSGNLIKNRFNIEIFQFIILSTIVFSFIGYLFYYKVIFVSNILSTKYFYSNKKIEFMNSISMLINLPFMFISYFLCDKFKNFKYIPIIVAIVTLPFLNYYITKGDLYSFFIYDAIYAMTAASIIPSILGKIPERIRSIVFGFSLNFSYGFFSALNLILIKFNKYEFINFYTICFLLSIFSISFYIFIMKDKLNYGYR